MLTNLSPRTEKPVSTLVRLNSADQLVIVIPRNRKRWVFDICYSFVLVDAGEIGVDFDKHALLPFGIQTCYPHLIVLTCTQEYKYVFKL